MRGSVGRVCFGCEVGTECRRKGMGVDEGWVGFVVVGWGMGGRLWCEVWGYLNQRRPMRIHLVGVGFAARRGA